MDLGKTARRRWGRIIVGTLLLGLVPTMAPSTPVNAAPGDWEHNFDGVNLGDVAVGDTTATNLEITNVSATTQSPFFSAGVGSAEIFLDDTTCVIGDPIAPGDSCTFTYRFTPNDIGLEEVWVNVTIDDETFPIYLRGTGVSAFSVGPMTLDFGQVDVGAISAPRDVVITNTSYHPLSPSFPDSGGIGPFDGTTDCPGSTLAPGATCSYTYTFTPGQAGMTKGTPDNRDRRRVLSDHVDGNRGSVGGHRPGGARPR